MRKRWIAAGVLVGVMATLCLAFIQIDDTHDQQIGGLKTFINSITGSAAGLVQASGVVVASLPTCNSTTTNSYATVTDATTCTGALTGGAATKCPVFCNGTAWANIDTGGVSATPTPQPTATPLAFGSANTLPKFAASELASSGITDDATTVTIASRNFSYGQALFITGIRAMSTSISSNSTDRVVSCTSGSSTDKTYTLPAPTGSGRVIDIVKVDSGTNACKLATASGTMNGVSSLSSTTQYFRETCYDIANTLWLCSGNFA